MTPSDATKPVRTRRSHEALACAKCQHVNPPGSNTCEACEAHLWVVCHDCGTRNLRVDSRCTECGHRLHRSALTRVSRKLLGNRRNISLWQIGALVIGVWVAYKVIIFFAEYRPPPPE